MMNLITHIAYPEITIEDLPDRSFWEVKLLARNGDVLASMGGIDKNRKAATARASEWVNSKKDEYLKGIN